MPDTRECTSRAMESSSYEVATLHRLQSGVWTGNAPAPRLPFFARSTRSGAGAATSGSLDLIHRLLHVTVEKLCRSLRRRGIEKKYREFLMQGVERAAQRCAVAASAGKKSRGPARTGHVGRSANTVVVLKGERPFGAARAKHDDVLRRRFVLGEAPGYLRSSSPARPGPVGAGATCRRSAPAHGTPGPSLRMRGAIPEGCRLSRSTLTGGRATPRRRRHQQRHARCTRRVSSGGRRQRR